MQGTIVKIAVEEGQEVKEGDLIVVLEAMKMEQPLNAHKPGTIKGLSAEVGASITSVAAICEIKDCRQSSHRPFPVPTQRGAGNCATSHNEPARAHTPEALRRPGAPNRPSQAG
jgi:pyruvate/2-oxoglutarate dehydrogenase complex dihydrolipoamide acyltransferase (E2) component